MTTEYEPDPTTEPDPVDEANEDAAQEPEHESGGSLRAKLVEALARISDLEAADEIKTDAIQGKLLDDAFAANGLSRTEGLGKAIALGYDGEPTSEALAQHLVDEYNHEFAGAPNPIAVEIHLAQAQLDAAGQGAGSVPVTPTENDALAEAEARGDYATAMQLKGSQLDRMMGH